MIVVAMLKKKHCRLFSCYVLFLFLYLLTKWTFAMEMDIRSNEPPAAKLDRHNRNETILDRNG